MGTIIRGFKNVFRNNVRSFSIVIILAMSIGMALVMLICLRTVQKKIFSVKESIGNTITITPAGIRGFEGGGELLSLDDLSTVKGVEGVKGVVTTVSNRLSPGDDTDLESAVEPGSFGERQHSFEQRPNQGISDDEEFQNDTKEFSTPISVSATSDLSLNASIGMDSLNITSGSIFEETSDQLVALIGSKLAEKNNLEVDSIFTINETQIKVLGIFDAGNDFSNASLIMPTVVLQNLFDQKDQYNSIIIEGSSIEEIDQIKTNIENKLGDRADIVSNKDSAESVIAPLNNIKIVSTYSLIGSLLAGAIIIFLTMVMIVRERRKEIGVLKAIGASNSLVMFQFVVESLFLTVTSSLIGIIMGTVLSNPILKLLVSNSQTSNQNAIPSNGPGPGGGFDRAMKFAGAGVDSARETFSSLSSTVGWEVIIYGILLAIVIAVLGSAIPSFIISRIRPAEVLRSD